jgi:hypothetical protein
MSTESYTGRSATRRRTIEVACPDDPEPHPGIVSQVHTVIDWAADADMDRVAFDQ